VRQPATTCSNDIATVAAHPEKTTADASATATAASATALTTLASVEPGEAVQLLLPPVTQ